MRIQAAQTRIVTAAALLALSALLLTVAVIPVARASDPGAFEIDGNTVVDDTATPALDWDSTGTANDDLIGDGDDGYTTPAKESDSADPSAFATGVVTPGKTDLTRLYEHSRVTSLSDALLWLGFDRADSGPKGDARIFFELNRTSWTTTPSRSDGDLRIEYDFDGGSDFEVTTWQWQSGAWSALTTGGATAAISASRTFGEVELDLSTLFGLDDFVCGNLSTVWARSATDESANPNIRDRVGPFDVDLDLCADLQITKTAVAVDTTGPELAGPQPPGTDFDYLITVSNVGIAAASDVTITDTPSFDPTLVTVVDGTCETPAASFGCELGDIGPGDSATVRLRVTTPHDDCTAYLNTAAVDSNGAQDDATVDTTLGCVPGLSITKSAVDDAGSQDPQVVTTLPSGSGFDYVILVVNDGIVTSAPVVVSDTVPAGLTVDAASADQGTCAPPTAATGGGTDVTCDLGPIAAGSTATVTISVTTTPNVCTSYVNEASYEESADDTDSGGTSAPVTVETGDCTVGIDLETQVSVDGGVTWFDADDPGGTIPEVILPGTVRYRFLGSNTDVLPLSLLELTDLGTGTDVVGCLLPALLAVAASDVVLCETGPFAAVEGVTTLTARLVGWNGDLQASATDPASYRGVQEDEPPPPDDPPPPDPDPEPAIRLTKSPQITPAADGTRTVVYDPDDGDDETVTYRYTVVNTGTEPLSTVTLDDDVLGAVSLPTTTLDPGEQTTGTAVHVVTAGDAAAGSIVNVATTTGTDPGGVIVTDSDTAAVLVVEVLPQAEQAPPAIAVTKTPEVAPAADGTRTVVFDAGDGDDETVGYSYTVVNTGTVPLAGVTLTDDVLGPIALAATTLDPGAQTSATAVHVVTAGDAAAGSIVNVATATGSGPDGTSVTATATATVGVTEVLGVQAVRPAPPAPAVATLPRTGVPSLVLLAAALLLAAVGMLLLAAPGLTGVQRRY